MNTNPDTGNMVRSTQGFDMRMVAILVLLLGGVACNIFDEPRSRAPETEIPEEGLSMRFIERMPHTDGQEPDPDARPELLLAMKTKKIMPCVNYRILHQVNKPRESFMEVTLLGIELPGDICLTALGPATAQTPFSEKSGLTDLNIRDGGLTDLHKVTVDEERVSVSSNIPIFSQFTARNYYRRPENSFYFRCGTLTEMAWLCDDFHLLMLSELDITEFHFPDDDEGVIPYPESSSGNWHNNPTRFYLYNDVADFHRVGDLLEEFSKEQIGETQGNSLMVQNWLDEAYRSWILLRDD